MRFNKVELSILACHPSHDFNKEGILRFIEKQEGFFRRNEIPVERWCRLRGNLLFYFKSGDPCSDPYGVFVLEHFALSEDEKPGFPNSFSLVFQESSPILVASTPSEKASWIEALQKASFIFMRKQIDHLLQEICASKKCESQSIETHRMLTGATVDLSKPPFLEMSLSCDNLRCDGDGIPPNPRVSVYILKPPHSMWILYAQTEVQVRKSNPVFHSTVPFRESDGIDGDTQICLIVCDVRERVSNTAIHLGKAMLTIQELINIGRTRLFLLSPQTHTIGFVTVTGRLLQTDGEAGQANHHATPKHIMTRTTGQGPSGHRRTQSLPPKLGFQTVLPNDSHMSFLYDNPTVKSFRFHSGLGGDIFVTEIMAEPLLCYRFPQQLLRLWVNEEKLRQEEILSLGDLSDKWNPHQNALLDQHTNLINMYGIALDALEANSQAGINFRKSVEKGESCLEFAPINLHLQRLLATNESLRRSEHYDIYSVGAFTANSLGFKKGGLLNMLQSASRSQRNSSAQNEVDITEIIIDNLRSLRREIILLLRLFLLELQKKELSNLMQMISQLQKKIRQLLQILDIPLVEKAYKFLESIRNQQDPPQSLTFASREYSFNSISGYLSPDKALDIELESPSVHDVFDKADHSKTSLDDVCSPSSSSYKAKLVEGLSEFCVNPCYKPSDEPEPWDLIQLNIKASLICLTNKIDNLCKNPPPVTSAVPTTFETSSSAISPIIDESLATLGASSTECLTLAPQPHKQGSPCLIKEGQSPSSSRPTSEAITSSTPDVSPCEDDSGIDIGRSASELEGGDCASDGNLSIEESEKRPDFPMEKNANTNPDTQQTSTNGIGKLALKPDSMSCQLRNKADLPLKQGLPLPLRDPYSNPWMDEVRPSMRKLRQAIEGLMRTARLTHSVFCLCESKEKREERHSLKYRRRICFSQALTSVVTALLTKLWCSKDDDNFVVVLTKLGPLIEFEVILSCYKDDASRLSDMIMAVEDLRTVDFIMVPAGVLSQGYDSKEDAEKLRRRIPTPRVAGTRSNMRVILPVPESILNLAPRVTEHPSDPPSFRVTPVLFNIGINEEATISAKLGQDSQQRMNNQDSFDRLFQYYHQYKKLFGVEDIRRNTLSGPKPGRKEDSLRELMPLLQQEVYSLKSKNVQVLHVASKICRCMGGIRFTSCKSAKDRTGMSVTLEEANILRDEYDLSQAEFSSALNSLRVEGTRRTNCLKNTGSRKYAFSYLQLKLFPELYRPPPGSFGSNVT